MIEFYGIAIDKMLEVGYPVINLFFLSLTQSEGLY